MQECVMRQRWIAAGTLITLVGCSGGLSGSPPSSEGQKETFVRQLVEFCAGVNRNLANVDPQDEPKRVADQLDGFVKQARAQPVPDQEKDVFDDLVSAMTASAAKFRNAAAALEAGDAGKADAAGKLATEELQRADRAATQYGMPHLTDCDKTLHPSASPTSPAYSPTDQPPVAWRSAPEMPVAVQQGASAVVDGAVWVAGGLSGGRAVAKVQGYDPVIDGWKFGPDLPIPLHHAMAVNYGDQLVVLGGWTPRGGQLLGAASDRVFVLSGSSWAELPRLNRPRAAGAAAVVGGKIVVVGGQADKKLVPTTEVFDGSAWRDAAEIPTPREHLAGAAYGSYLYAVGGRRLSADKNLAALEQYDLKHNTWKRLPPMPTARGGLAAAVVDRRLIAVGGEYPTTVAGTVEAYDIASSAWSALPPLSMARHGLTAAANGRSLYAVGGAAKPAHTTATPTMETLTFS
jgi:Kelch motif